MAMAMASILLPLSIGAKFIRWIRYFFQQCQRELTTGHTEKRMGVSNRTNIEN